MNNRTRYFLIGSGLVVVVGLCTGLVAYYSGSLPVRGAAQASLAYVPADASTIAYADVRRIMQSGFRGRLRDLMPTGAAKNRLAAETGIDLEQDIDSIVAGMGSPGASGGLVLLRGRFDAGRLETVVREHGGGVESYRGKTLFLAPAGTPVDASHPLSASAVALLEPTLLALGSLPALKQAIETAESRRDVTGNRDLMSLMGQVEQAGHAWIVSRMDGASGVPLLPAAMAPQMPPMTSMSLAVDVEQDLSGTMRMSTVDPAAAEQLRSTLNSLLSAVRLMGGADPSVQRALASLQSSGSGRDITLSFTVTPEILHSLSRLVPQADGGSFGRPDAGGTILSMPPR